MKASLVRDSADVLESAGYRVLDCSGLRSCFDLIAGGDRLLLVKVLSNIEGLTQKTAFELRHLAVLLSATPVVVGSHMKSSSLARGVVYERYGLRVVSLDTFSDALDESFPLAYAVRGNYCVGIDSSLLARLRRSLGLTQEEFAERMGVSKQSIHRYEFYGRVSLDVAERLLEFLEDNIVVPQDLFSTDEPLDGRAGGVRLSGLKRLVLDKFRCLGFSAAPTNAPFDILAVESEERILTTVSDDSRRLRLKIELVEGVSELLGCYGVCVSNRNEDCDVVLLKPRELSGIRDSQELLCLLS